MKMWLSKILHSKYTALITVVVIALVLGSVSLKLLRPQIIITIVGSHDPVHNSVFLNGDKLFPYGENGAKYSGKLKSGDNVVELKGPYIQTSNTGIRAGIIGGKQLTNLTPSPKNIDEIVKETFVDPEATFTGTRLFKESDTIISYVTNTDKNTVFEEGFGVIIVQYNLEKNNWVNITEGFLYKQSDYKIGESAVNYLREFGDE
jgi:hypothetical protein